LWPSQADFFVFYGRKRTISDGPLTTSMEVEINPSPKSYKKKIFF
jgi:hypothetical protein